MFEHLYSKDLPSSSTAPRGCYVSFAQRIRERLIAGAVGLALGLAGAVALFMLGAAA